MTDKQTRAREAQTLLSEQSALPAVLDEIRQEAVTAFLNSGGDADAMAKAFKGIEAVNLLKQRLQSRIADGAFEAKKEQQRGTHA